MPHEGSVLGSERPPRREVGEVDQVLLDPLPVRLFGRKLRLHLDIVDDPSPPGVAEEHPAGLEAPLANDAFGRHRKHPDLGREHDKPVVALPVPCRTEPVAVEDRADQGPVGETDRRGTVPRLHQRAVERVEGLAVRVHLGVVLPGLRDHHQDRVGKGASPEVEELDDLVERG